MILYCCSDLMWATKVKSTADSLGIACRPARNAEMLAARLADSPVKALIVDLESGPVALELIQQMRSGDGAEAGKNVRIIAFAPHVNVDGLQAAKQAGADSVMARGSFAAALPDLLQELAQLG